MTLLVSMMQCCPPKGCLAPSAGACRTNGERSVRGAFRPSGTYTHRVTTSQPRRRCIAGAVGLSSRVHRNRRSRRRHARPDRTSCTDLLRAQHITTAIAVPRLHRAAQRAGTAASILARKIEVVIAGVAVASSQPATLPTSMPFSHLPRSTDARGERITQRPRPKPRQACIAVDRVVPHIAGLAASARAGRELIDWTWHFWITCGTGSTTSRICASVER
jgi:hypothetical protein